MESFYENMMTIIEILEVEEFDEKMWLFSRINEFNFHLRINLRNENNNI